MNGFTDDGPNQLPLNRPLNRPVARPVICDICLEIPLNLGLGLKSIVPVILIATSFCSFDGIDFMSTDRKQITIKIKTILKYSDDILIWKNSTHFINEQIIR